MERVRKGIQDLVETWLGTKGKQLEEKTLESEECRAETEGGGHGGDPGFFCEDSGRHLPK